MPRPTPLVHPDLQGSLGRIGQFPSTCTVQERAVGQDDLGQDSGNYDGPPVIEDVPCRLSVLKVAGFSGEQSRQQMETVVASHMCRLQGYFPQVKEAHRAIVDGDPYDIRAVEHDSSKTFTDLRVQQVT